MPERIEYGRDCNESVALGVHTSYKELILGSVLAVLIGLVLELFLFSVDYARCESLQYEDDEYYYYVKAVPKVTITSPEKTVKRINERQATEIIDTNKIRKTDSLRMQMLKNVHESSRATGTEETDS